MDKKYTAPILSGTVLICLIIPLSIWFYTGRGDDQTQLFCTLEAKMCPDGSYVGRSRPTCEFEKCPSGEVKETTSAKTNERILNNGFYITPLEVVSDSRCPQGVQCIWEGTVSLKVRIEEAGKNTVEEKVLEMGKPSYFLGGSITLYSTSPYPVYGKEINESDYLFTFNFSSTDF